MAFRWTDPINDAPVDLAKALDCIRIGYFSFLVYLLMTTMQPWFQFPDFNDIFLKTHGLYLFFDFAKLQIADLQIIWGAAVFLGVLGILGFGGRIVYTLFFLCFGLFNGLPSIYQTQTLLNMPNTLAALAFLVICPNFRWSLDRYFFKRSKVGEAAALDLWVLRSIPVIFIFSSGLQKLNEAGLGWITDNSLRSFILCREAIVETGVLGQNLHPYLKAFVYDSPSLVMLAGALTLLLELTSPIALFSKKFQKYFVPVFFLFQLLTIPTLLINPMASLGLYLFWLPPSWVKATEFAIQDSLAKTTVD